MIVCLDYVPIAVFKFNFIKQFSNFYVLKFVDSQHRAPPPQTQTECDILLFLT